MATGNRGWAVQKAEPQYAERCFGRHAAHSPAPNPELLPGYFIATSTWYTLTKVGEAAKIHLVLLQIGVRWSAIQISGLGLGLHLTSSPRPILLESDLGDAAYLGNIDAEPSGLLRLLVFWF